MMDGARCYLCRLVNVMSEFVMCMIRSLIIRNAMFGIGLIRQQNII
jgi:hypothetical protein